MHYKIETETGGHIVLKGSEAPKSLYDVIILVSESADQDSQEAALALDREQLKTLINQLTEIEKKRRMIREEAKYVDR